MAYTVRRRAPRRVAPNPRALPMQGFDAPPDQLLATLDEHQAIAMSAMERMSAEPNIEALNAIVERANLLRDELAQTGGEAPARLEREVAEVASAFRHFADNNALPSSWNGGSGRKTPWGWIGLGVAALGGLWWWTTRQQDAAIDAMLEAEGIEDCGCGG